MRYTKNFLVITMVILAALGTFGRHIAFFEQRYFAFFAQVIVLGGVFVIVRSEEKVGKAKIKDRIGAAILVIIGVWWMLV